MFYEKNSWFVNPTTDLERALVEVIDHHTEDMLRECGGFGMSDSDQYWDLLREWYPDLDPDRYEVYNLMEIWWYSPRGGAVILDEARELVVARIIGGNTLTLDEAIDLVGEMDPANEDGEVLVDGNVYYYDDLRMEVGF